MIELIDFESYPVNLVKRILLKDKATKQNIIWATNSYEHLGFEYSDNSQIQEYLISKINKWIVQPRVQKSVEQQQKRTRTKAEVFTPAWLCNKMNNLCDEEWFCKANVFNTEVDRDWQTNPEKIEFSYNKGWQKYIDQRILEITCGEAPYLCSRYDTSTGQIIPINNRIGILDRKSRVINENTTNKEEWYKWVIRAFQSCYGYEYQGDSLLIARINMLLSFYEYYKDRWSEEASINQLKKIANIISWNLWQMDGLKGTVPNGAPNKVNEQLRINGFTNTKNVEIENYECKLYNWRADRSLYYSDLKGVKRKMKFDFAIGNPPYQDNTIGENDTFAPPVYNIFMDETLKFADKVELIHPARFLFNAGSTPKLWNKKMLNDKNFKIISYISKSSDLFPNTDIKGGIVISYHDNQKDYGAIEIFTPFWELNNILHRITSYYEFISLSSIIESAYSYHFTPLLYEENPKLSTRLSKGHKYDLKSNVFDLLPEVFADEKINDKYIKILGRQDNQRTYKWIKRSYVTNTVNLEKYKVFIAGANGSGAIGEVLSTPLIGTPLTGNTESFISIGAFDKLENAENCMKYVKTKFARTLLGLLKVTQAITPGKWKYVPIQDFTENSDIDWSKSIHEIDLQLYKKYNLDDTEIEFIEKNVKEMS